ncbi:MAG: YHS domain-containing protein [SAR202 cluster bacterium]|nr:YHS domain-containing protein [SAR202 cluster bacterium]
MSAVFAKPEDRATDPVCKMIVDKRNPPGSTAEHEGKTYYFCAPGCRETFKKDPTKFL